MAVLLDYTKLFEPGGNVTVQSIREPFGAEFFSDKEPGSMEPGFDGAFVQAQDAAHFFGAQPFHIAEH